MNLHINYTSTILKLSKSIQFFLILIGALIGFLLCLIYLPNFSNYLNNQVENGGLNKFIATAVKIIYFFIIPALSSSILFVVGLFLTSPIGILGEISSNISELSNFLKIQSTIQEQNNDLYTKENIETYRIRMSHFYRLTNYQQYLIEEQLENIDLYPPATPFEYMAALDKVKYLDLSIDRQLYWDNWFIKEYTKRFKRESLVTNLAFLYSIKCLEHLTLRGQKLILGTSKTNTDLIDEKSMYMSNRNWAYRYGTINILPPSIKNSIKLLDLSGVESVPINQIKHFKNLEFLDISDTEIDDLTSLINLKKLKYLNLTNCRISIWNFGIDYWIGSKEYDKLKKSLPNCIITTNIKEPLFRVNPFGDRTYPALNKFNLMK